MKQKKWLKIVLTVEPQLVEPLTDFLVGVFRAGVESEAKDEPNYGRVIAWFEEENLSEAALQRILRQIQNYLTVLEETFAVCSESTLDWELVADQDWSAEWKKFFTPFSLVEGLVIVPSWEEYSPQEGEQTLVMEPGMAFGTGHHDTTRFSLELIKESLERRSAKTMLDVGTGTGILSMGALLFAQTGNAGTFCAKAIDNDPEAVNAAQENIERNTLQHAITVSDTPLAEVDGTFDIVAANIIHDVLVAMKDDLIERVAEGGSLILSGILAGEQLESICRIFSESLQLQEKRQGEEWAACHFIKTEG